MNVSVNCSLKFCCTLLLLGAGGVSASAQEEQAIKCDKVPAAVRTAFQTAYPKATIRDCSKEIEKGKVAYEISSLEDKTHRVIINEINTMPGFTTISMYSKMWVKSGVDYPTLVDRLVRLAVERHADKQELKTSVFD